MKKLMPLILLFAAAGSNAAGTGPVSARNELLEGAPPAARTAYFPEAPAPAPDKGADIWMDASDIADDPDLPEAEEGDKSFSSDWEAGRNYALKVLAAAQSRGGPAALSRVAASLSRVGIQYMSSSYRTCRPSAGNTGFVKGVNGRTIYVCAGSENMATPSKAQFLIHESSHLAGMANECTATRMEMTAMKLGAGAPAYRNGYADGCGL